MKMEGVAGLTYYVLNDRGALSLEVKNSSSLVHHGVVVAAAVDGVDGVMDVAVVVVVVHWNVADVRSFVDVVLVK